MNIDRFLQQYAEGKREFVWADLRQADLSGAVLPEVNLSRANLSGAILQGADLSRANLSHANLTDTDLRNANLTRSNLRRANLTGAQLTDACLTDALLPPSLMSSEADPLIEAMAADDPSAIPEEPLVLEAAETARPDLKTPPPSQRTLAPDHSPSLASSLPYPTLGLIALGYALWGGCLFMTQAAPELWAILALTPLVGRGGEKWLLFMPLVGAIITLLGMGLSVIAPLVSLIIAIMFWGLLTWLGWGTRSALRDALWIAGGIAILLGVAPLLFFGSNAFGGGGIIIAPTVLLGLMILAGVAFTALGSVAVLQMAAQGLASRQINLILIATALVGLGVSWGLGMMGLGMMG